MSRAYRVRVNESERRIIRAGDSVRAHLGLLDILPPEEMAGLLERELLQRGFRKVGDELRRDDDGVVVTVDPCGGTVSASAKAEAEVQLEARREGVAFDDVGPHQRKVRADLREHARADLERQATQAKEKVQQQATDALECKLLELKPELDKAVNRATAEALKRKAAQLGEIKQIHDDIENGTLTIQVEL